MSYLKANLGAIVLPVPDDEYTLDEYREKYGIDLTEVFDISGAIVRLKNISKPLYFYDGDNIFPFNYLLQNDPEISFGGAIFTTEEGTTGVSMCFGIHFIDNTTVDTFEI